MDATRILPAVVSLRSGAKALFIDIWIPSTGLPSSPDDTTRNG